MPTISEVADLIVAADVPALFVDTCALLDVIRAIKRRDANCVTKASELKAAAFDSRCSIVVSHLVRHEWQSNQQELLQEANRHLAEMEEQSAIFHDACVTFRVQPDFSRRNTQALTSIDFTSCRAKSWTPP